MKISKETIANIKIDIKFSPELVIYFGKNELGRISCKDTKDMEKFMEQLKESIEIIMEDFKDKEEK